MKRSRLLIFLTTLLCLFAFLLSSCDQKPAATPEESGTDEQPSLDNPLANVDRSWDYRVLYQSNGDGTCTASLETNFFWEEDFDVVIPETSPDGDTVTKFDMPDGFLDFASVPRFVSKAVFEEKIQTPMLKAIEEGALGGVRPNQTATDNFYYRQFMTYFILTDSDISEDFQNLPEIYPWVNHMACYYAYDINKVSVVQIERLLQYIHEYTTYTDTDMQNDYEKMILSVLNDPDKTEKQVEQANAFFNRSPAHLKSLSLPDSLTSIGNRTFYGCDSLKYNEYENGYYLGNASNPYLVLIQAKSSDITSCVIAESTKIICSSSFSECKTLRYITIPYSVMDIGDFAFSGCSSLTSITIPDGVMSIGDSVFYGCSGLTGVTIPYSVMYIGDSAFSRCSSLTSITIPDGVINIGDSIFSGCSSLTSITIPDSVTNIGSYAFYGCSGLTGITIPDSVMNIGDSAFYGCSGLTGITIPDSVMNIGDSAFSGCSSLTCIIVEESNQKYHNTGNCLIETKNKTLIAGCKNSIIPTDGSVTAIGNKAFYYCIGLTSITIPDSVTSIGECAFYECSGLTNITISNSVMSIGYSAFSGCSSLTSITIPDSVTNIDSYAFSGCNNLMNVTFANTTGWYIMIPEASEFNLTYYAQPIDVTETEQNATYLKEIYRDYDWIRTDASPDLQ